MALSFPAFPTVGQTSTQNGRTYTWTGNVWQILGSVVGHASQHASGAADAITPASIGAATTSAGSLTTGTLADARLSTNVTLISALNDRQSFPSSGIDVIDRLLVGGGVQAVSGAVYWTFFTPLASVTVTQIAAATSAGTFSTVTLARMGIYTADASGNATLVARTASDTTLFAAQNTVYTRSLDTTGGYPASYTLAAGTRYAAAVCVVASAMGNLASASIQNVVAAVSPKIQGVRTGNTDLVTSQTSSQFNGTVGHAYWFRLS